MHRLPEHAQNVGSHLPSPTLNRQLLYKEMNSHQVLQTTQRKQKGKIIPERQVPFLNCLLYLSNHKANTEPTAKGKGCPAPRLSRVPDIWDMAGWLDNSKRQIPKHKESS